MTRFTRDKRRSHAIYMEMGVVWMPKRLIKRLKIIASYREVPIWKVVEDLLNYTERSLFQNIPSVPENVSWNSMDSIKDGMKHGR